MIFRVRSCWISARRNRKALVTLTIVALCLVTVASVIRLKQHKHIERGSHETLLNQDDKSDLSIGKRSIPPTISTQPPEDDTVNYNVYAFYYAWYKTPAVDGQWSHWNHVYIPNWEKNDKRVYPTGQHQPPEDIGSNYFPLLGCYSSRDPKIIQEHMKQYKLGGIGVLVLSWLPLEEPDPSAGILPLIMEAALQHNIKVSLHIEPYENRDPVNLLGHLSKFIEVYGSHPALHRIRRPGDDESAPKLPVYFVYDSYHTSASAWKEMLSPKGNMTVRGTLLDGIYLGLLVEMGHRHDIARGHFDGFYTYFATNGFTYGSSWKNWRSLSRFAQDNKLMFVPSVGPGYVDTQVRPWNSRNTRHRGYGKYYGVAWRSALALPVPAVSITSFNEWHEGTQIEPAVPFRTSSFAYLSYEPQDPHFYLNLTLTWVKEFTKKTDKSVKENDRVY